MSLQRVAFYMTALCLFVCISACTQSVGDKTADTQAAADCVDPFCTYAPPLLTGDGMAAAVREIISATPAKNAWGYQGQDGFSWDTFLKQPEKFQFVSPYFIARRKDDTALAKQLGRKCITTLTEQDTSTQTPLSATGPVYLYRIRPSLAAEQEYTGVLVYGYAPTGTVQGMSFEQRVAAAQSSNRFFVLMPGKNCKILRTYQPDPWVRSGKQFTKTFYPTFFGVGYFDGKLLLYSLSNRDSLIEKQPHYRFTLALGWPEARDFEDAAYQDFINFPPTFDPFAIVARHKQSR